MRRHGSVLFVHAHPDDEALFTSGAMRRLSTSGRRVILITCTDGRLGLDSVSRAGNDPRHDAESVAVTRAGELARSTALLGVSRHVILGYRDSGLADWPTASDPSAFVNADQGSVARTIAAICDEEDVEAAVSYDESGYYGHPDHIAAHGATAAAVRDSLTVQRLYYPVTPARVLEEFRAAAAARGLSLPLWVLGASVADDSGEATVTVDVGDVLEIKRASMAAHGSQVDNADLVTMEEPLFRLLFGHEYYRLGWSRPGSSGALDDLCGGDE